MELKSKLAGYSMALAILATTPALAARLVDLPPVQTQNGITYMTGGVGQPELTDMRGAAGRYSLMMTFAQRNGDFLDDIKVDITDRQGNQILYINSGPIPSISSPAGCGRQGFGLLVGFSRSRRTRKGASPSGIPASRAAA